MSDWYPDDMITSKRQIPAAPYYVVCKDTFMSGWGPAGGKTNWLCFVCKDWREAEYVARYAEKRGDMQYVRICYDKPVVSQWDRLWQLKTCADYPSWYGAYDRNPSDDGEHTGQQTSGDFTPGFMYITDDREIYNILHDVNKGYLSSNTTALMVEIADGDYVSVWGCDSAAPYRLETVYYRLY